MGLWMLCALLVSAFAAQSASAVTKGTTAHTCTTETPFTAGTNKFEDAHCTKINNTTGTFGHKEIKANTTTHALLTNAGTSANTAEAEPLFLKMTIATIPIVLKATGVSSTEGWLENRTEPNGEHYTIGEGKLDLTGMTVAEPANCKVEQAGSAAGEVRTTQLVAHTKGQEENMFLKFEPKAGVATAFAEFEIVNNGGVCAAAQKLKFVGSFKARPNGATIVCTHADITTQGTLRFGSAAGPKGGLEGKITIKAGEGKEGEGKPTNPIAPTTVETP